MAWRPPIRMATLHPSTMGDAPTRRFGRIQRWGRVIGGVLPSELNRFFFTQQSTGLWLIASPTARYPPIPWRRWRQFDGVAASTAAAARRETRRQHCGGGGVSVAAQQRRQRQWQRDGNGNDGAATAEAAVSVAAAGSAVAAARVLRRFCPATPAPTSHP